jgi:hypothetical protein
MNVDLVKRVTADILMTRLRNKGVRHPDHTRAMIKGVGSRIGRMRRVEVLWTSPLGVLML